MKPIYALNSPRFSRLLTETPRVLQWVVWGVSAGVSGYWASQLLAPAPHLMARPAAVADPAPSHWIGLFAVPESHVTVQLRGLVAADEGSAGGIALLAVDNGPTRAYRVGREIAPGVVLQHVGQHDVTLTRHSGDETLTLVSPPPAKGITFGPPRPH
ncbi:MAG: hypothetical protein G3I09_08655 [Ferrovum sp.]|nr:hypothetical protein [Ferrovum sp.]